MADFLNTVLSFQIKARKMAHRNIINYPSSFYSVKKAENQRQSSQEKNSSLTNYCLTIKNNHPQLLKVK